MAREIDITSEPNVLFDGQNEVVSPPARLNQIASFVDMDMNLASEDWIEESFELLLNSDTTQSIETKSLASSNESEETDVTQQVTSLASKRRIYRRRLKAERETLKQQESELTKELAHLHMVKDHEKLKLAASRSPAYFFWKNIACRQREQRTIAEAEQSRLATAIRIQSSYINTLRDIVQKRRVDKQSTAIPTKKHRVKSSEASMIDAYIQDLDRNYLRTDEVFRTSDSTEQPGIGATVHSVQMRESDGGVEFYQQLTKTIQPFSLCETGHSMWASGEKQYVNKQDYARSYDVKDPENTIAVSFVETKMLSSGTAVPLMQRLITRRFIRDNCIIHTWKFITDGKGIFNRMQMDETGWCRLRPSLDASQPGTTVELCIRRVPLYFRASPRESAVDDFHSMVQEVSDEVFTEVMESIKTLLLENLVPENIAL